MTRTRRPVLIQGGMGIAVSSWQLAREVSRLGQLGVVSGTALDGVVARRLQDGDEGGHIRRALRHFPSPAMADRILSAYFLPEGRQGKPYRPHPTMSIDPGRNAIELAVIGNFVEVWLAKEGHDGVVGINLLEKVQTSTLTATFGAMLADVDYVIMGAGIPKEMPQLVTDFAAGRTGHYTIDVHNATKTYRASLDPVAVMGDELPTLNRPDFLAIVSLHVLASYLNRNDQIRPDGFIVEGPKAGGHSATPRGKMTLNEAGEPIYGPKDDADIRAMVEIGLPFWLAGTYGTADKVREAIDLGAQGVQAGTVFALCEDSGLRPSLRDAMLSKLRVGSLVVKNDPLASPTGFPFKVAQVPGTQSEDEVYQARERICDLGYLRSPVERPDGSVQMRCASEPVHMYMKKGGDAAETDGRKCLCNALMANIGLGQQRKNGYVEQPALTLGQDLTGPEALIEQHPQGWTARDAVTWLLSDVPAELYEDQLATV
ncbi:MAG TPA: nitronate monooxygenase [Propionibacteriaceae bacterium]|nr:nitronate monooxygenase [Propionibacteriaceae bacterium]HQE31244.1 nitronate monooxygenase [Propionibacteriaceae bacterium]